MLPAPARAQGSLDQAEACLADVRQATATGVGPQEVLALSNAANGGSCQGIPEDLATNLHLYAAALTAAVLGDGAPLDLLNLFTVPKVSLDVSSGLLTKATELANVAAGQACPETTMLGTIDIVLVGQGGPIAVLNHQLAAGTASHQPEVAPIDHVMMSVAGTQLYGLDVEKGFDAKAPKILIAGVPLPAMGPSDAGVTCGAIINFLGIQIQQACHASVSAELLDWTTWDSKTPPALHSPFNLQVSSEGDAAVKCKPSSDNDFSQESGEKSASSDKPESVIQVPAMFATEPTQTLYLPLATPL